MGLQEHHCVWLTRVTSDLGRKPLSRGTLFCGFRIERGHCLLCVKCHASCSMELVSCPPHNNSTLGEITTPILRMRPPKHREVDPLARGHTASN